jgi:uncharacterized protein (UPF0333 family)
MEKEMGESRDAASYLRGQVTPEFIIIIAALLIILGIMLVAYRGFEEQTSITKERLEAERIARSLANAINWVEQAGDGTEYVYLNKGNEEFGITVAGREIIVNSSDAYASRLLLTNMTNASSIGMNEYIRIRNADGIVYVEPV